MHKNILVPLDGSAFAEQALPAALAIARHSGAALKLLTVSAPLVDATMEGIVFAPAEIEAELLARCKAYLDGVAERIKARADVAVTIEAAAGDVAETIVQRIGAADLAVVATHGRGATERFWLGSMADELMRRAEKPLLLVRSEGAEEPRLSPALVCLDGSAHAETILEHALALAATASQPEIVLLRAIGSAATAMGSPDVPEARKEASSLEGKVQSLQAQVRKQAEGYLEGVAEKLRGRGMKARSCVLVADDPAAAILEEAKALRAGMIALETHGRSGLSWMFLSRGVVDKVVRGATVPVLVHRRPA